MHASARPRVYRHLSTLLSPSARAQSHAKIASNEKPLPISIQSGLCQLRPARLAVSPFPPPPSACLFLDTHLCLSLVPIPHFEILSPRLSIPFALLARAGDLSLHFTFCLRLPLRVSQLPVIVARSRPGKSRAHAATTSSRASHHSLTHS